MTRLVFWLIFWWLPVCGIAWDGTRWRQGDEVIPEYVVLGLAMIWLVLLVAGLVFVTLWVVRVWP